MSDQPAKKAAAKKAPAKKPAAKPVEAPDVAAPSAEELSIPPVVHAPLDAPVRPAPPAAPAPAPRAADGAADTLEHGPAVAVFCEATGEVAKPECLFTDPIDGVVRSKCRLIEHGTIAPFGRKVQRLLLAKDVELTAAAAASIAAQVRELNGQG